MSAKAERLPRARLRRMRPEQREAYDRLRWYSPGPAERARLKKTLGWKRTREETIALARELLAKGRMVAAAADELGVGTRYLKRLLEQDETPLKVARNRSIHAAVLAPTCETQGVGQTTPKKGRSVYGGDPFAYDFRLALDRAEAA